MHKKILLTMAVMMTLNNTAITTKANNETVKVAEQSKAIFNSNDIRGVANITSEQLRQVVPETMKVLVNDIVYYCNRYDVNALAVTGIIRQESGNNTSNLSISKNNLGGIKAGNEYKYFNSKAECIEYMVKLLKNDYLTPSGRYFNGYSLREINENYCPNDKYEWSNQVTLMGNTMLKKIKQL